MPISHIRVPGFKTQPWLLIQLFYEDLGRQQCLLKYLNPYYVCRSLGLSCLVMVSALAAPLDIVGIWGSESAEGRSFSPSNKMIKIKQELKKWKKPGSSIQPTWEAGILTAVFPTEPGEPQGPWGCGAHGSWPRPLTPFTTAALSVPQFMLPWKISLDQEVWKSNSHHVPGEGTWVQWRGKEQARGPRRL